MSLVDLVGNFKREIKQAMKVIKAEKKKSLAQNPKPVGQKIDWHAISQLENPRTKPQVEELPDLSFASLFRLPQ